MIKNLSTTCTTAIRHVLGQWLIYLHDVAHRPTRLTLWLNIVCASVLEMAQGGDWWLGSSVGIGYSFDSPTASGPTHGLLNSNSCYLVVHGLQHLRDYWENSMSGNPVAVRAMPTSQNNKTVGGKVAVLQGLALLTKQTLNRRAYSPRFNPVAPPLRDCRRWRQSAVSASRAVWDHSDMQWCSYLVNGLGQNIYSSVQPSLRPEICMRHHLAGLLNCPAS